MAITDYASLQAAVASWLARADLSASIPDFITLAETRINRELRLRAMEQPIALSTVAGSATVALPARYLQMRVLTVEDAPMYALDYRTPEDLRARYGIQGQGKPKAFTLEGDSIRLGPTPDAAYSLGGVFYQGFAPLATGANWLIGNAPDLYLYATLLEAMPFVGNDARLGLWQSLFANAVEKLGEADGRDRHSGGALQMRTDTGNP